MPEQGKDGKAGMELRQIKSFQVDHTKLLRGVYISREDGDIVTYDLRMKVPNKGDYLANGALHTIEHLFATFARSSEASDHVVYFGPMGCRTGFYFLTRGLSHEAVLGLIRRGYEFIASFEGAIPGAAEAECGNYREHDLEGAKKEAREYLRVLENVNAGTLHYLA